MVRKVLRMFAERLGRNVGDRSLSYCCSWSARFRTIQMVEWFSASVSVLLWRFDGFRWFWTGFLPAFCCCRQLRLFSCLSLPSLYAGCLTMSSPCGWSLAPFRWMTPPLPFESSPTACPMETRASTLSSMPSCPRTSGRRAGRSSPAASCVRRHRTTRWSVSGQKTTPARTPPPTYEEHSWSHSPAGHMTTRSHVIGCLLQMRIYQGHNKRREAAGQSQASQSLFKHEVIPQSKFTLIISTILTLYWQFFNIGMMTSKDIK